MAGIFIKAQMNISRIGKAAHQVISK